MDAKGPSSLWFISEEGVGRGEISHSNALSEHIAKPIRRDHEENAMRRVAVFVESKI